MEKMYLVIIECMKEYEDFYNGNTIKAFTNEKEAFAYFQGLVDAIWTDGALNDDYDCDYCGRTYKECMEQRVFTSTDWLEIACAEIENGSKLYL